MIVYLKMIKLKIFVLVVFLFPLNNALTFESEDALLLKKSISNENRKKENRIRDIYRNPFETLKFFGISRKKKILEVSPGGGWYSEILSYFMKGTGNFYVTESKYPAIKIIETNQKKFREYFRKNMDLFGEINTVYFDKSNTLESKENQFDIVLTFRNSHNWLEFKTAENIYKSIFKTLKKGGVLGVVQHKANEDSNKDFHNGYVKESFLIDFIEKQGFIFVKSSKINANLKDKKNYSKGVWTLPPRLIMGDLNKEQYIKIGESDRMTLKFIKP